MDIVAVTNRPVFQRQKMHLGITAVTVVAAGMSAGTFAQEVEYRAEELVITATRLPRTIENIAGTVSAISSETIEHEMVDDLDDIARYQPGITLDTASRGGNLGFRIRGIGGNRVLTVIDGIRSSDVYAAGPSAYGKDSFEVDNLKSIEIVRGPASVLYGADAMGGAVLLNSKDPSGYTDNKNGSYFKLRSSMADADAQYKAGFTGAFQKNELGAVFEYTHREFEEQDVNGRGSLNPQDGESDALLLKSVWDINENQSLTFVVDHFTQNIDTVLASELGASVRSSIGRDETVRKGLGLDYNWNGKFTLADELQLSLKYQQNDALQNTVQERTSFSFIDPRDPSTYSGADAIRNTDFEFNQETLALNLNLWKNLEIVNTSHSIAYGLNFDETQTERPRNRCETVQTSGESTCQISAYPFAPSENFPNKTFPDSNTKRFGVYFQDEITIANTGLTLIPGYRYDRYEMQPEFDGLLDASELIENFGGFRVSEVEEGTSSLSLGAIYDLSDKISVFSQYAEGYRPPNFDEANQAFVNLGFGYATIPNAQLKAESSKGIEFGIRANLDNAFMSLVAFRNKYDNFIESAFVDTQGGISLFQDQNIGSVKISGVEAVSNWYLSDEWELRTSLAYIKGDNESANVPLDSVDPLTGIVGLRYDDSGQNWGGELIVTAADKKDRVSSANVTTAGSYATTDLIAYYRLSDSATIRFGAFNLFDEEYARWTNLSGLPVTNTNAIQNSFQPGSNFRLGFSYEL
jgi:hemoglobin/transferrin/lactoferrin receptor protein